MPENDAQKFLQDALQVLVGLPLSIARDVADMKVFHFGPIRPNPSRKGTVGTHALHIQCPWRIVSDSAVVTGVSDYFVEPQEGMERNCDDHRSGTRQFVQIATLLNEYDETTRSFVNDADRIVVVSADADRYGGADLLLSGGYRLQIFPAGSLLEDWRFIELEGRDIVIEGGRVDVEQL